jgi:hypothetical protein
VREASDISPSAGLTASVTSPVAFGSLSMPISSCPRTLAPRLGGRTRTSAAIAWTRWPSRSGTPALSGRVGARPRRAA